MTPAKSVGSFTNALPFWLSLALVPLPVIGAIYGGSTLALTPLLSWHIFTVVDAVAGLNEENPDTETQTKDLFWYRLITMIWPPVQFVMIFGLLAYVTSTTHLRVGEKIAVMIDVGILSGTIGIVYSHELLHQKNTFERWLGDILLSMVLYSHFRTEHLLVHHIYVGTPKDAVTARYNEGFHRYFARVLVTCPPSAFDAERKMLARRNLAWWHRSNPFWRYCILQGIFVALALMIGGVSGLILFMFQALTAVFHLELVNYIEHYGLTRKHLGGGKYEPVLPHHSWNAEHRAANWMLINLQRHSDHHYKPNRRYPLLQTYGGSIAPQLPYSYPFMGLFAFFPSVWRRVMNHRIQKWRAMYYPEITDWSAYNKMTNPKPR